MKKKSDEKVDPTSAKTQAAVEKAWAADQPKQLCDAQFGVGHKGQAYRMHLAPVVRSLCDSCGCDCNPSGLPKLREIIDAWQPDGQDWVRVKRLLLCCCDELCDAMSAAGVEVLEDNFLFPDAQKHPSDMKK